MNSTIVPSEDTGLRAFVFESKYARFNRALNRRELIPESMARVEQMHLNHFDDVTMDAAVADRGLLAMAGFDGSGSLHDLIRESFAAAGRMEVLPSMRSLQFGGPALDGPDQRHARMYNCCFSYASRLEFFSEAFWLLLCGAGVGFSVQRHHIDLLPAFAKDCGVQIDFVIPDTIEGWADALKELLGAAVSGISVEFDYSLIRPAGTPLKTAGGKAPGPGPLKRALESIQGVLRQVAGRRLEPIEAYDIMCHAALAVRSGGIRRSAMICIFSPDDDAMMKAKTGNWFETAPWRSASNNSAMMVRGEVTREQYDRLFETQKEFGEPGFYFSASREYIPNPCVEITGHPTLTVTEKSLGLLRKYGYFDEVSIGQKLHGFQFCNLTTINGRASTSPEIFYGQVAHAAAIGTLQAAYTNFGYLSPVSRVITEQESLLGTSICGVLDSPDVLLDPVVLRTGAEIAKAVNRTVAAAIGIPKAARVTCEKPEGTTSLILNSGSGAHPHHARRYFRRVQVTAHDPVLQHFAALNPHMVETSIYDQSGNTKFVTFAAEAPEGAMLRSEVTALRQLEIVAILQDNWVAPGTQDETFAPGARNNVSNTISVKPEEWAAVADFIWVRRDSFTGVAMLPWDGDKTWAQAPREAVITAEDERRFESIQMDFTPVDYSEMVEHSDKTELLHSVACAGGQCELP